MNQIYDEQYLLSFLAFQRTKNNLDFILIQFCVIIIPTLIFSLPGFNRGPSPSQLIGWPCSSSPQFRLLIGRRWSWMKRRRKRAAGSRRRRLDRRVGCAFAAARTHRLSIKQRGLALSRSPASVGEWGWCCFAAPGRKNAWERKKVRRHRGVARGGGGGDAFCCASAAVPLLLWPFYDYLTGYSL